MKIIEQSYEILTPIPMPDVIAEKIAQNEILSVEFVCDIETARELSYLKHVSNGSIYENIDNSWNEYCLDITDSDEDITFIWPCFFGRMVSETDIIDKEMVKTWKSLMTDCEVMYFRLLKFGCSPKQARSVLPNSTKTIITVRGNYSIWIFFFGIFCYRKNHDEFCEKTIALVESLLFELKEKLPKIFGDITYDEIRGNVVIRNKKES